MVRRARFSTAALALSVAACGGAAPPDEGSTMPGALVLHVRPQPPSTSGAMLWRGALTVEAATVFGDVEPASGDEQSESVIDLASSGMDMRFDALPQGLYSRARLLLDDVEFVADLGGTRIVARFDLGDADVDVRAPTGSEVASGLEAEQTLTIDLDAWFDGLELDDEDRERGIVFVTDSDGGRLRHALAQRIAASFRLD